MFRALKEALSVEANRREATYRSPGRGHPRSTSGSQWSQWWTTLVKRQSGDARSNARPLADESGRTESRGAADEGVLGEAERWDEQGKEVGSLDRATSTGTGLATRG